MARKEVEAGWKEVTRVPATTADTAEEEDEEAAGVEVVEMAVEELRSPGMRTLQMKCRRGSSNRHLDASQRSLRRRQSRSALQRPALQRPTQCTPLAQHCLSRSALQGPS